MYRPGCCHFSLLLLHIFNIFHQCQRLLCLTIDNRLTIVANDCYGRISIGSKLPDTDNVLQVDAVSLTECKESCRNDRNGCDAFSFGVGLKGNSTCLISSQVPLLENLEIHPEYDVYVKKRHDTLWCDFDRLYYGSLPRGSGNGSGSRSSTDVKRINKKERVSSTGNLLSKLLRTSMPALITLSRNKEDIEDHWLIGLDSFINHEKRFHSDDKNRRILDIVANKNDKTVSTSPLATICHRKMLPGKKMMELLVERVVSCENVQDCCQACDYEKTFVCKGFNHRHRTDDSKCICELTSTPHFRMDVDEDFSVDSHYDYYEKNQNCLPSILYDNSLSPRSKDRIKSYGEASDRSIYEEIYLPNGESTLEYPKGILAQSNKRLNYEEADGGFASRQNAASNWNMKWKNTDNTFSNSPLNYDKEYSDVKPSIFSESPVKQNHRDFYGKFDYYGDAFDGYNANSYVPVAKTSFQSPFEKHEKFQITRRCSTKAVSGSKLSKSVLRKTCLSHDFEQCEDLCINEMSFSCQSFAYRYNVLAANPTDNCLLSDVSYRDLNFYTDLEPDRDYDSYVLMSDTKICDTKKSVNRYPSEECFSRIRSGFAMPMDITKKSMFANDLGECQFACTASQQFLCRSFVFKYATKNRGRDHERVPFNCFLSDWPSEEMNPGNMPDMDGAELYERNIFSYGCEIYPSTSFTNSKRISPTSYTSDELCYSEHHRPCKLMSHAIVSSMRALTKSECREKCSAMRNTATIPCMSFNYLIINIDGTQDNCFLSDISRGDLRPNLDYVRDNDHVLYTWKELDPSCGIVPAFEKYGPKSSYRQPPFLPSTLNDRNTQRTLDGGSHIYKPIFHSSDQSVQSDKRFQSNFQYNHELPHGDGKSISNPVNFEHEPNFLHSSQLSPFRRYTVNGDPCRNGTVCQRNEITGFWSCETENEYAGNWDYCCEPNHQCGYSQGYHYPWCYVGSNEDQWRPCSETYNPYYSPKDRSIYRQSPLYTARHWPVIYFHETSPPNCSINDS